MNPAYLSLIFLFIILVMLYHSRRSVVINKIIKKRKMEGNTEMIELAKRFIGKECVIYAFDSSHQFVGVIREVTDHAILLENEGKMEAINLDFVIRIREFPKNKKGKKKSVVLD